MIKEMFFFHLPLVQITRIHKVLLCSIFEKDRIKPTFISLIIFS